MFPDLLRQKLDGVAQLSRQQVDLLESHYHLLRRWNRVLNLTSVDSLEQAVERHYAESLFLAAHLPPGPLRIADIGSGAGFPGIPIAIARPDCSIVLVEAHQRKAVFLREASRELRNVRVLAKRANEISEAFDHAVSRAVRYQELGPILKRIAVAADLLTGIEDPPPELGFRWEAPIPLPWGRQRFLRIGISVSRETDTESSFHVKH